MGGRGQALTFNPHPQYVWPTNLSDTFTVHFKETYITDPGFPYNSPLEPLGTRTGFGDDYQFCRSQALCDLKEYPIKESDIENCRIKAPTPAAVEKTE